jgi:hypothetical protein
MNRFRDYLGFAVTFSGLGYVILWPVSTPGNGELFGAALLCGGRVARALDLVCRMPHPLQLGVGLHVFGALCALLAALHLLVRTAVRLRGAAPDAADLPAPPPPVDGTAKRRPRPRRMPPPRKLARPRSHFGLRGVPQ